MNINEEISKIKTLMNINENSEFNEPFSYEIRDSEIHGKGIFANKKINKDCKELVMVVMPNHKYHYTDLGRYMNHSKNPNVVITKDGDSIIANVLRDINPDEELLLDYFPWAEDEIEMDQIPFNNHIITPTDLYGDKIKYIIEPNEEEKRKINSIIRQYIP
jgi:hypothetical protein